MIIHKSPMPDVEIPNTTITEWVLKGAGDHPDRAALIDGPTGRTISFAEFESQVKSLAGGLASKGFGPGSVLGIMAPNIPEYAIVFHAVATAGGTVTTINPTYGAEEIKFQLRDAGASVIVTISMFADTAREAAEGTNVETLLIIDSQAGVPDGFEPLIDYFGAPIDQVPVDVADHVVVLPYSSGTTGLPKGVMLTHRNLVANLAQIKPVIPIGDDESALAVLPFFHIYGMQVLMNELLGEGCTVITMPRFDLIQALELVQDRKITRFFAVPPIVLALAKQPVVSNYDLSSLRQVFSGAAPLGAELAAEASARVGCPVVQGYGMTELSPVSHSPRPTDDAGGSVGIAIPNVRCRLVDPDTNEDQPVGGVGELWVSGPMVMKGYLNNPEATAATIDEDGWLHTGDVATLDEKGLYTIVDRVKELIKYKGFQVPPAELEALLLTHPAVADVAVIGVDDLEAGELPKAFVVMKPGHQATAQELQAFVAQHVATYKQIRIVEFIDEIPKSASGKILRRLLRQKS